ncbi:Thiol peroxidase [[Mycoplasma] cavipharyngis]|uniref:redoxin family protein n=1 Tax=[Mycoplasma] cavipharyngis TaxID=92757 RepID=UPI0037047823
MSLKDYTLAEVPGKKLEVNDQFPDFSFYTHNFEKVSLSSLPQKIKVIMTLASISGSVCSLQLKKLSEQLEASHNVLLTISYDSPIYTAQFSAENKCHNAINFSLAGSGAAGTEFLKTLGIYVPEAEFLCYRSIFVIDANNKILYVEYAPKLKTGLNLEAVNQFIDSHLKTHQ